MLQSACFARQSYKKFVFALGFSYLCLRHTESASAFLLQSKLGHFEPVRRKRLVLALFFSAGISSIFLQGSPRPRLRVE